MKRDKHGMNPASKPSGDGCVECLASPDGWWLHLRRCATCGHIGCCDSSPGQHASKHAEATGHPIIASFEPGEDWFYDYEKGEMIEVEELLPAAFAPGSPASAWPGGESSSQLGIAAALTVRFPCSTQRRKDAKTQRRRGVRRGEDRRSVPTVSFHDRRANPALAFLRHAPNIQQPIESCPGCCGWLSAQPRSGAGAGGKSRLCATGPFRGQNHIQAASHYY